MSQNMRRYSQDIVAKANFRIRINEISRECFFCEDFYHAAIYLLYNLIIKYLIVVVDTQRMVVNDKLLEKSTNNRGNIWFFNQVFVSLWAIFEY